MNSMYGQNLKFAKPSFLGDDKGNGYNKSTNHEGESSNKLNSSDTKYEKKSKNPMFVQVWDIIESAPINGQSDTQPKQFLSLESISEKDIMNSIPPCIESEGDEEEEESKKRKKLVKVIKKEKIEEPSPIDQLLNARELTLERKETLKLQMSILDSQLEDMEKHLKVIEEEEKNSTNSKTSKTNIKHHANKLVKELERMALERKANEIVKNIDKAMEDANKYQDLEENEHDRAKRLEQFYQENAKLYKEIDKLLGENHGFNVSKITVRSNSSSSNSSSSSSSSNNSSSKKKHSGISSKITVKNFEKKPQNKGFNKPSNSKNQQKLTKKPKKLSTFNPKLSNWGKIEFRKLDVQKDKNIMDLEVKNPKKVEILIQNAKNITQKH